MLQSEPAELHVAAKIQTRQIRGVMESCDLVWPISQLRSSPRAPRDYFLQQWKSLCITVPVWSASINKPAEDDSSVKASFNKSIAEERWTPNVEENNLRNRRERESQICVKQKCLWGNGVSINVLKRAEIIQSNTRRWLWREARSNPEIRSPCYISVRLFVLKTAACIPSLSLNIIPTDNKENDPADG